jgi:hypothetical protein
VAGPEDAADPGYRAYDKMVEKLEHARLEWNLICEKQAHAKKPAHVETKHEDPHTHDKPQAQGVPKTHEKPANVGAKHEAPPTQGQPQAQGTPKTPLKPAKDKVKISGKAKGPLAKKMTGTTPS